MAPADKKLEQVFEAVFQSSLIRGHVDSDRLKLYVEATKIETKKDGSKEDDPEKEETPSVEVSPQPKTLQGWQSFLESRMAAQFLDDRVVKDSFERLKQSGEFASRRIAQGEAAVQGRDGKLLPLVKRFDKHEKDKERLSNRTIKHFDNIEPGTPIARVYHPKQGKPGRDVFGQVLEAAEGKAFAAEFDESITMESAKDGQSFDTLYAAISGYLEVVGGKLQIRNELVINGDLDYSFGDIDFVGSVVVKGDLLSGFKIMADGDVEVKGNVEGGSILSRNGNIRIGKTLIGTRKAGEKEDGSGKREFQIRAAGSISAAAINGAFVDAGEAVEVKNEVRNSEIRTRSSLNLAKGSLISGDISAICGLEAGVIGNPSGIGLRISLCCDAEFSAEYKKIQSTIDSHIQAEEMLIIYLGPYAETPKDIVKLSQEHKNKLLPLAGKLEKVRASLKALELERQGILTQGNYNSVLRVNFHQEILEGVTIRAGECNFVVKDDKSGPGTLEFDPEKQTFAFGDLKPLECDLTAHQSPQEDNEH
jgi:hypothetical protein